MTSITIMDQTPYTKPVSVVWNDLCNHDGAEYIELEVAKATYDRSEGRLTYDDTEYLDTLVCPCGMQQDAFGEWL